MSLTPACCCDPDYVYFLPCAFTEASRLRMTTGNFSACGFNYGTVYHYDDGFGTSFCGSWTGKWNGGYTATVSNCSHFTAQDDCCQCLQDNEIGNECTCFNNCLIYRCNQGLPNNLEIDSYLGGSGGNSAYNFEVISVNVGPITCDASYPSLDFTVSGNILVTLSASSYPYTCDGFDPPPPVVVPFTFDVKVQCVSSTSGSPPVTTYFLQGNVTNGPYCQNQHPVCPDATDKVTDSNPSFTACDLFHASFSNSAGQTPLPDFNTFCDVIGNFQFAMTFPMNIELQTGGLPGTCEACDQAGVYHGVYFPNVNATANLSLVGRWV